MTEEPKDGRREYTDVEFLTAIKDGASTTQEIADRLGCTRQAADYRLRKLREDDHVDAEKIGNTLVWSVHEGTE